MTNSISQIGNAFLPGIPPVGMNENGAGIANGGLSFKDMMLQSLDNINQLQVQSEQAIEGGVDRRGYYAGRSIYFDQKSRFGIENDGSNAE